jgi:hypothetical protein
VPFQLLPGDLPDDPVGEKSKLGLVASGEGARLGIEQAESPKTYVLQEDKRGAGIEPDMGGARNERVVSEPLVGQGILDHEHLVAQDRLVAEGHVSRGFPGLKALCHLDALANPVEQGDRTHRHVEVPAALVADLI